MSRMNPTPKQRQFDEGRLMNVLVVEPRYADPVSLVHYKKVLVTKGAVDKLKEMFA